MSHNCNYETLAPVNIRILLPRRTQSSSRSVRSVFEPVPRRRSSEEAV